MRLSRNVILLVVGTSERERSEASERVPTDYFCLTAVVLHREPLRAPMGAG